MLCIEIISDYFLHRRRKKKRRKKRRRKKRRKKLSWSQQRKRNTPGMARIQILGQLKACL
jgi:hypothetical protein